MTLVLIQKQRTRFFKWFFVGNFEGVADKLRAFFRFCLKFPVQTSHVPIKQKDKDAVYFADICPPKILPLYSYPATISQCPESSYQYQKGIDFVADCFKPGFGR